jgi:hypothetical protein
MSIHESPLLVLTGADYAAMPFQDLHDRLCTALRGNRPRLVLEHCSTSTWSAVRPLSALFAEGRKPQAQRQIVSFDWT